jgi:hypothetical protein
MGRIRRFLLGSISTAVVSRAHCCHQQEQEYRGDGMSGLRETLEDVESAVDAPTRFKTEGNTFELRCAGCGELFYVDQLTFNRVQSALGFDPTDDSFRCNDCDEQYEREAFR